MSPDADHQALRPLWGPYLSERAWGTVREDYSANGDAWTYFTHDDAHWRTYRWSEDGLAGLCDVEQRLCLALALWNGRDARILKERAFGLGNGEGNHGEDVKEYWWYLDALPDHSWLRWRYHYPQAEFPYTELVEKNDPQRAGAFEFELLDTDAFDHGYWIVEVTYAKAAEDDVVMRITAKNAGDATARLHVLPTLWFRNTWAWGDPGAAVPELCFDDPHVKACHETLGTYVLEPLGGEPREWLFCDNETNASCFQPPGESASSYPKDAIARHVLHGEAVNPARRGTKASAWYRLDVDPQATAEVVVRLRSEGRAGAIDVGALMADREKAADDFYRARTPKGADGDEALILRQAFAGLIWSQQYYGYDVDRWARGDQVAPPAGHCCTRNTEWHHLKAADVIAMPDTWEYPWFAAWDLAFHAVVWAHLDAAVAKEQLKLLCRKTYQHPDGRLPAYEWEFSDANPPVHAWAALKVWEIDGGRDDDFLAGMYERLRLAYDAWLAREDSDHNGIFEGGFLGLDNISLLRRSSLAPNQRLEQSDATAWSAFFALAMASIAERLSPLDAAYLEQAAGFLDEFAHITEALSDSDLWDPADAFFYDRLRTFDQDGHEQPAIVLKIRSIAGLIPLIATARFRQPTIDRAMENDHFSRLGCGALGHREGTTVSVVEVDCLLRMLSDVLDKRSFLSPYGLRSLSAAQQHYAVQGVGDIDYEPAEATTDRGANSNWRGPVWFPLNYLLIDALARIGDELGADVTMPYPTGCPAQKTLAEISADLRARLISLWRRDNNRRPVHGGVTKLQSDPEWRDNLLFFEYFHGENGAGLGAMHQTGWTALVADLIAGRGLVSRDPLGGLEPGPLHK